MANNPAYDVSNDTIFVTGLPEDTNEEQLAEYFGQIGIIKLDKKNNCKKIWIYKDKTTGKGKGEATITYDDPPTATSAIAWFNGKEFNGSNLSIELAQRKSAPQFSRDSVHRGGGRGGYRGDSGHSGRPGGGSGRPGDWQCPSCSNNNFAYRQECNRCKTQKPGSHGGSEGRGSASSSNYNGSGRQYGDGGGSRGSYSQRSGGSNYGDNDFRDRSRHNNNSNSRDKDFRERDNYRGDRDRDRNDRYGSAGGPSRSNNVRGREERRHRPY